MDTTMISCLKPDPRSRFAGESSSSVLKELTSVTDMDARKALQEEIWSSVGIDHAKIAKIMGQKRPWSGTVSTDGYSCLLHRAGRAGNAADECFEGPGKGEHLFLKQYFATADGPNPNQEALALRNFFRNDPRAIIVGFDPGQVALFCAAGHKNAVDPPPTEGHPFRNRREHKVGFLNCLIFAVVFFFLSALKHLCLIYQPSQTSTGERQSEEARLLQPPVSKRQEA